MIDIHTEFEFETLVEGVSCPFCSNAGWMGRDSQSTGMTVSVADSTNSGYELDPCYACQRTGRISMAATVRALKYG